ncbi:hypothetical protein ACQKP1_23490 [Allorhizobium sp. NPDC080224]|jgi:hypothetical protein|uniref:hypothetical protein n=1 Tax=Allorhizobium sp. NPDC080224 TaxID=3390547 RepID=UPI0017B2FF55|nr:hypothetical protein [Hyphomicrobiales bacterium]
MAGVGKQQGGPILLSGYGSSGIDLRSTRRTFDAEECLKRLEGVLGVGYWTFETGSGALHWSPGFYALLGLKSENLKPDTSVYNGMLSIGTQT